jgi:hypothetical protein
MPGGRRASAAAANAYEADYGIARATD